MEYLIGYYLMPHPPIIIPEIGKGEEKAIKNTSEAMRTIGAEIKEKKPDTIILITPHGFLFRDAISVSSEKTIFGNLKQFRAESVTIEKKIDTELTDKIIQSAKTSGISVVQINPDTLRGYRRNYELDHGAIVPLYFIEKEYCDYNLVHITYGLLDELELYRFGMILKTQIEALQRRSVIIASGDLSHRLTKDGPYPYSSQGKKFDSALIEYLQQGNIPGIFTMNKEFIEEAGECALRSIYILLGAMNNAFEGTLLSYEGPFGVGYGVMKFTQKPDNINYYQILTQNKQSPHRMYDPYTDLARKSLEYYYQNQRIMPTPKDLKEELKSKKAGVFVSLKKHGNLRGCIGTFLPTKNSIGDEIIHNALEAALEDPRFEPVSESELKDLEVSVDVLSEPKKTSKEELDPKKYGVIVSQGYKRGLLLPDLEGVDTVDYQLRIACQKAGISMHSQFEIYKFTVERHSERDSNES